MSSDPIAVSAPGSLMLFGEHAVLHGRLALVAAVDRRLTVRLAPRRDDVIALRSALGEHRGTLRDPGAAPSFRFVLAAVRARAEDLPSGFDREIRSEFSSTIGFGSSAAVTAATVAVLQRWSRGTFRPESVLVEARQLVREVQGVGSGADVAASVRGGIVLYRAEPMELEVLPHVHPFTAVYSGSKRPTPEVIALVEERRRHYPKVFEAIFEAMERCTLNAADAVAMQDWRTFGAMMDVAQGLMDALGVNNAALSDIVHALRSDPGILGAKISGSGLGDCAIGLGRLEGGPWTREVMPVGIDRKGIHLEEG